MTDDEFNTYFYYNPFGYDYDILNKPSTNQETSKFMKKLSNKGYSAVVDMADTSIGYSDAPVVILNAENSLELKSNNLKWSSRYDGWVD